MTKHVFDETRDQCLKEDKFFGQVPTNYRKSTPELTRGSNQDPRRQILGVEPFISVLSEVLFLGGHGRGTSDAPWSGLMTPISSPLHVHSSTRRPSFGNLPPQTKNFYTLTCPR